MKNRTNDIIAVAEEALVSIQDWRQRERTSGVTGKTADNLIEMSLLPPIHAEPLAGIIDKVKESEGEVGLALHAISCVNFIGMGEQSTIRPVTSRTRRWKRFASHEFPSFLKAIAHQGIRTVVGFCVSDLADFIEQNQQGVSAIDQNVTAMQTDLDIAQKELQRETGPLSPQIRTVRHSTEFRRGPLKASFDELFQTRKITHRDVKKLWKWLLTNAATAETDPFLTHASEDDAIWQIFTSGILYAADAHASTHIMKTIFPAERIHSTVLLNLFPDFKADAVIQRVFIDALVPEEEQPTIISPFPNAGRWEGSPVASPDFSVIGESDTTMIRRHDPLEPEKVFHAITTLPDESFVHEGPLERKVRIATAVVKNLFGEPTAEQLCGQFHSRLRARQGREDKGLPILRISPHEQVARVLQRSLGTSGSDARRRIRNGEVRIDGKKITAPLDSKSWTSLTLPPTANIISVGKRNAWKLQHILEKEDA